jgi:hypothetical protein
MDVPAHLGQLGERLAHFLASIPATAKRESIRAPHEVGYPFLVGHGFAFRPVGSATRAAFLVFQILRAPA